MDREVILHADSKCVKCGGPRDLIGPICFACEHMIMASTDKVPIDVETQAHAALLTFDVLDRKDLAFTVRCEPVGIIYERSTGKVIFRGGEKQARDLFIEISSDG